MGIYGTPRQHGPHVPCAPRQDGLEQLRLAAGARLRRDRRAVERAQAARHAQRHCWLSHLLWRQRPHLQPCLDAPVVECAQDLRPWHSGLA